MWLGQWEIVPVPGSRAAFRFTATVQREHEVWGRERPQDLVLALGSAEWVWHAVSFDRHGDTVTVLLTDRPAVARRAVTTT